MGPNAKFMVDLYEWSINQWLEDSPLTKHQELQLEHGGETLEEMLRTDLERLHHWRLMEASSGT